MLNGYVAFGSGTLLLAIGLAAATWRQKEAATSPRQEPLPHAGPRPTTAWRLAGLAGSLLLLAGSLAAWFADPAAIFGLQGALWLASIGLLLTACARWSPGPGRAADPGPPWTRAEGLAFAALVGLALVTYTADLTTVPWHFHGDELTAYAEAMRFFRGPPISLFTTTWWGTSLPSLPFAASGGVLRLAGTGLGAVRLSVALIGACTTIPVYGLARLGWGRTAAALAAFAVATTPVAIHYSRVAIDNSTTGFAWAVCFYFLLRGLRSWRPSDFAWAGLAAGFSMYTYYGTRLLPFLLLAFGAYLALGHWRAFRAQAGLLALVPAGFLVGFGPLLAYFLRHPEQWAARGLSELSVPAAIPTTGAALAADWGILAPLLARNFLGLAVLPSNDHVYWAPLLLPPAAVLLLLGLGMLLGRLHDPAAFLLVLWITSVVLLAGTLVTPNLVPAFANWTPAFPALLLVLALPPAAALGALRRRPSRTARAAAALLGVGLAALAAANAYFYLIAYPPTVPPAFQAAQGRFLATLGPGDRVRFAGDSWVPFSPAIGALLAPAVPASDFLNPSRALPLPGDPTHNLVFAFNTDQVQYLPVVADYYPGGQAAAIVTPGGPIGMSYRVPAALALRRYGVHLALAADSPAGGILWAGQVPEVGTLPPGLALPYPVTATWSGALYVAEAAPLRLSVAVGAAQVWVQGQAVAAGAPIAVDRGWVPLQVQARLAGPAPLRFLRAQGAAAATPVPTTQLWPAPAGTGLAATLAGAGVTHRVDPFVGASILLGTGGDTWGGVLPPAAGRDPDFVPLAPAGGAARIRWAGELYAEGGRYQMEMRTDARARLALDGRVVLDLCANTPAGDGSVPLRGGFPVVSAPVTLAPGWHAVQLDLDARGRRNGLEWAWTRPDGVREIVPPDRLRYAADPLSGAPRAWPAAPAPITCAAR